MTAGTYLDHLHRARASAIVRASEQRLAGDAMEAAIRSGFRVVEFTLTTPGALELIEEFSKRRPLSVGAGTVLSADDARRAVKAGACCLVSPVFDEAVVHAGLALGVAVMPGAHTPTELLRAYSAGAQLQKLFPAPAGGPAYLRSVRGPLPFLRIVPTNGVDADNVRDWLDAGAFAVGFTTALFEPSAMRAGRLDAIEARARRIMRALEPEPPVTVQE